MRLDLHREDLHQFSKLSIEEKLIHLFASMLVMQDSVNRVDKEVNVIEGRMSHLEDLTQQIWQPTQKLLKGLLGHYLIKLLDAYSNLDEHVGGYIYTKAEWLRLGIYVMDPIVRITLDDYLTKYSTELRSSFQKQVTHSVTDKKKTLAEFAHIMVAKYHLPVIPKPAPQNILAVLALMRDIAAASATRSTNDTNYWVHVDAALNLLAEQHGGHKRDTCSMTPMGGRYDCQG
ncbi:hypothetical protein B0H21DRAFT_827468 [Amylocystis lapponica]|nr:hypothetical protein B0H21DRAFT_827468 [Amylocystis lapponica]